VNEWYGSTLYSRLNDKTNGKILLIMQRLHQDDLTGHLLESDAKFGLVKLPVIAIENETWPVKNRIYGTIRTLIRNKDELLHPDRENLDTILDLKGSLGEYAFAGQYQQEPCPAEGGIIKEDWLQYYDASIFTPQMRVRHLFISWDTANKSGENNAYSVGCVIIMTWDYKFYLVDVIRGKWDTPELFDKITAVYNDYKYEQKAGNYVKLLIEDKASGEFLIPMLNKAYDSRNRLIETIPIKPSGDKISRAKAASIMIEKGNMLFPQHNEPWWLDFKRELLGFPGGKYKDQVDAMSQCINYAMEQVG
jgi:predicted phage terminase large subunit-like protein